MKIAIYQINTERDTNHVKFRDGGPQVNAGIYDEVFRGEVDCRDLEDVFYKFNHEGHPLHRGHSLSVSDVVVTEKGAFICQTIGFEQVEFDQSMVQKPEDLMRIVYVEPGMAPYEAELPHTVEAMQKAVGGLFEFVQLDQDTILVCNDEGKLIGMEGNRRLDSGSIIAGPFFLVGDAGEECCSLTDEQVSRYMQRFAQPEMITPAEVEMDTGFTFISF